MDPARMFKESLTSRPELENSQGHSRPARDGSQPGHGPLCRRKRTKLSCGDAAGTDRVPETVAVDCPPVANGTATVSAAAWASHLDCSRTYIGKLEADGVIQRQGDGGFPLDQLPAILAARETAVTARGGQC